jgi:hypothetical protein
LMRVLPIAFMASDIDTMNVMAFQCSAITHNSEECIKSCQFYCLLARMIADQPGKISTELFTHLWTLTGTLLDWNPERSSDDFGSGYVIDTLNIVRDCIEHTASFKEADPVRRGYRHNSLRRGRHSGPRIRSGRRTARVVELHRTVAR